MNTPSLLRSFLAGAMAVLVFHQATLLALKLLAILPAANPWNLAPGPFGIVPVLLNAMFWGGLWGIVLGLLWQRIPGMDPWLRGPLAGIIGPALVGGWIVLPLIRNAPLFAGGDAKRLAISAIIHAMFGLGFALFWLWLRPSRR
ncbi:MAG: hypothetical protein ACRCYS_03510 [Beijerinckiaceae bacterium]